MICFVDKKIWRQQNKQETKSQSKIFVQIWTAGNKNEDSLEGFNGDV